MYSVIFNHQLTLLVTFKLPFDAPASFYVYLQKPAQLSVTLFSQITAFLCVRLNGSETRGILKVTLKMI